MRVDLTPSRDAAPDGLKFMCAILNFRDTCGRWPIGAEVNRLFAYKAMRDKSSPVRWLHQSGFLAFEDHPTAGPRDRREYVITDAGREVVTLPDPLPSITPDIPTPFPEDPCEERIYDFHYCFWRKHDRWPTGIERNRLWGDSLHRYSKARRVKAYENLVDQRVMSFYTIRGSRGSRTYYAIIELSPEYADKNGWVFYAPPSPS